MFHMVMQFLLMVGYNESVLPETVNTKANSFNGKKLLCHISKSNKGPCSRNQPHKTVTLSVVILVEAEDESFQKNSLRLRPVRVLHSANRDCLDESVYVCTTRLKKLSTNEKPPGWPPRAASIKILMSYSA